MLTAVNKEINSNTIIVEDFITPHLHQWTDHPDRELIKKQKL